MRPDRAVAARCRGHRGRRASGAPARCERALRGAGGRAVLGVADRGRSGARVEPGVERVVAGGARAALVAARGWRAAAHARGRLRRVPAVARGPDLRGLARGPARHADPRQRLRREPVHAAAARRARGGARASRSGLRGLAGQGGPDRGAAPGPAGGAGAERDRSGAVRAAAVRPRAGRGVAGGERGARATRARAVRAAQAQEGRRLLPRRAAPVRACGRRPCPPVRLDRPRHGGVAGRARRGDLGLGAAVRGPLRAHPPLPGLRRHRAAELLRRHAQRDGRGGRAGRSPAGLAGGRDGRLARGRPHGTAVRARRRQRLQLGDRAAVAWPASRLASLGAAARELAERELDQRVEAARYADLLAETLPTSAPTPLRRAAP